MQGRSAQATLLVVEPGKAQPVPLPPGRAVAVGLGPGAQVVVSDAAWSPRELSVTALADAVLVEPLQDGSGVRLNEVPLFGPQRLQAGDELRLGEVRLLICVTREAAEASRPRLAPAEELLVRLADEAARAHAGRALGLVLVALPPLNTPARAALARRLADETLKVQPAATWAELGPQLWAAVVPEVTAEALAQLERKLPQAAPRGRVVLARSGPDGEGAEALLGAGFARLYPSPHVEVLRSDPLQVRLGELVEHLEVPLLAVEGPEGSGRATLARAWLAERAGRSGRFTEVFASDEAAARTALASKEPVLLKGAHGLELAPRAAPTAVTLLRGEGQGRYPVRLWVPGLSDRPSEVLELAALFLARAALGRPRLVLAPDARMALGRYAWPGNVRELENAVWLAASAAVRDEVGRDALPYQLIRDTPQDDLRDALQSTERTLLLEALARTRWNVTAAATRLGLPRRTVVYRMKKLGLKRPARHGPARL